VGGYGYTIAEGEAVGVSGQGITLVNNVIWNVTTPSELAQSLAQGGHIQLNADIVVPLGNAITVSKNTEIYLNGYDLDFSAYTSRPIEITGHADLVIWGDEEVVKVASYGLIKILDSATNVNVTLNGGNYVSNMDNGAFVKPFGSGVIEINLNDITFTDSSSNSLLLDGEKYVGSDLSIHVDGGVYTVSRGIVIGGPNTMHVENAIFNCSFLGFEASGTMSALPENAVVATIDNCTITVNSSAYDAMNACVAVGYGGQMTVKNCTLISNAHVASVLSKPTSKITLEGCTITATDPDHDTFYLYEGVGTIERNNCSIDQ